MRLLNGKSSALKPALTHKPQTKEMSAILATIYRGESMARREILCGLRIVRAFLESAIIVSLWIFGEEEIEGHGDLVKMIKAAQAAQLYHATTVFSWNYLLLFLH